MDLLTGTRKKKRKIVVYDVAIVFLILIMCVCATQLISYYLKIRTSQNKIGQLKEMVLTQDDQTGEDNTAEETNDIFPKYKKLLEKNSDFVGWLTIPDTVIDYPVMQNKEDNEFYLHRDFNKKYDFSGLIFVDNRCNVEKPSTNTIVYGHNMKAGTMFATLLKYRDEEYIDSHRDIYFDTIYGQRHFQVFAAFPTQVYPASDEMHFKYYDFIDAVSEEEFQNYIEQIMEKSYCQGEVPTYTDEIITLSTCGNRGRDNRFVVMAKRVE